MSSCAGARWAELSGRSAQQQADRILSERVVGLRFPKPLKRRDRREQLPLAPPPEGLVRYGVEVRKVEFDDGTLWPPEAWNKRVMDAAERGELWAWHTLGMQYLSGDGRPQDDVLAYAWLHLSALTGNEASIEARDALGAGMAPQALEEAERLSRTWAIDQLVP